MMYRENKRPQVFIIVSIAYYSVLGEARQECIQSNAKYSILHTLAWYSIQIRTYGMKHSGHRNRVTLYLQVFSN